MRSNSVDEPYTNEYPDSDYYEYYTDEYYAYWSRSDLPCAVGGLKYDLIIFDDLEKQTTSK